MWSLFGDSSLPERIHTALNVLWKGLAPRDAAPLSPPVSSQGGKVVTAGQW